MAKKKSKNNSKGQKQPALSPYRFMREKREPCQLANVISLLLIGRNPEWLMSSLPSATKRQSVMASFLVDTFCLGVKNAGYHENMTPYDFEQYLDNYKNGMGLEEISYNEAHNIIYGAMAFAEEGGIKPSKEFDPAGYIRKRIRMTYR